MRDAGCADSEESDRNQARLDPVVEAELSGDLPALDPAIEDPTAREAVMEAIAAHRVAWEKVMDIAGHLPNPWHRFRVHVASTLRLLIRARRAQELAVRDLDELGVLNEADQKRLFADLSALQEQYGAAIDEIMGTALESGGDMLSALQRAQLMHKWLIHVQAQAKQLRGARNLAVREALTAGVPKAVIAKRLDVTTTAIRNIINGPLIKGVAEHLPGTVVPP